MMCVIQLSPRPKRIFFAKNLGSHNIVISPLTHIDNYGLNLLDTIPPQYLCVLRKYNYAMYGQQPILLEPVLWTIVLLTNIIGSKVLHEEPGIAAVDFVSLNLRHTSVYYELVLEQLVKHW